MAFADKQARRTLLISRQSHESGGDLSDAELMPHRVGDGRTADTAAQLPSRLTLHLR